MAVSFGGIVYNFAISYYILEVTGSSLYFSINLAIMSTGAILSLPIAGIIVDSFNRRTIIITLEILASLSLLILTIYLFFLDFNIYVLFIITAVRSIIMPTLSNAFDSSMTQLFNVDDIQTVLGKVSTFETSIGLLGPILAGIIYGFLPLETMVLIFFIMQLISLILDYFLEFNFSKPVDSDSVSFKEWTKSFKNQLGSGFDYIKQSPILIRILVLAILINGVGAASFSVLPETIMIKELNFTPQHVGVVSAIMGCGSLIGSIILSKVKIQRPLLIVKSALAIAAIFLTTFTLPVYVEFNWLINIIYIGLIGMLMASVFQFINIPLISYMQKSISDDYKGRVFSLNSAIGMILMPFGTVVFGILYNLEIYFAVNLFSAIIILLTISLILTKAVVVNSSIEYKGLEK